MKFLLFPLLAFVLFSCSSNKGVYWCGDHACINNKEKEAYFKKTMIVEIKQLEDQKTRESDLEIIKRQSGLDDNNKIKPKQKLFEKTILGEKDMAEQIRLEEKRRIKEEKDLAEQIRLEEKRRIREEKDLAEQIRLEEKKIIKHQNKKNKPKNLDAKKNTLDNAKASLKLNSNKFDDLMNKIREKNMVKSYPNINDIPQ